MLGLYEAGFGEEVADRGGDVGFGLAFVVASEDFGGGLLAVGVSEVDVDGHWVMVRIWLGFAGERGSGMWMISRVGGGSGEVWRGVLGRRAGGSSLRSRMTAGALGMTIKWPGMTMALLGALEVMKMGRCMPVGRCTCRACPLPLPTVDTGLRQ